jgi:hypothetical protein
MLSRRSMLELTDDEIRHCRAMTLDGYYETDIIRLKCPDDLCHLFLGDRLTIDTDRLIGKWVAGGEAINRAHDLSHKEAFDAAAKGVAAWEFFGHLTEAQATVLRPIVANLKSAAQAADEEAEQQRQAREELQSRAVEEQRLRDPFGGESGTTEEKGSATPFGYSGLRSLAVPVRTLPAREETTAEMLRVIAGLADPEDTATNGRFKREIRDILERMRQADREAWSAVEHRLGDRDREIAGEQRCLNAMNLSQCIRRSMPLVGSASNPAHCGPSERPNGSRTRKLPARLCTATLTLSLGKGGTRHAAGTPQ